MNKEVMLVYSKYCYPYVTILMVVLENGEWLLSKYIQSDKFKDCEWRLTYGNTTLKKEIADRATKNGYFGSFHFYDEKCVKRV